MNENEREAVADLREWLGSDKEGFGGDEIDALHTVLDLVKKLDQQVNTTVTTTVASGAPKRDPRPEPKPVGQCPCGSTLPHQQAALLIDHTCWCGRKYTVNKLRQFIPEDS